MNKQIRDGIFFLLVFFLIFNNIPKPVQLSFLGGPAGGKLSVYPLLAGFLYSFYCQYKYGGVFSDFKKFARYIAAFIGVMLLSTVVGLITYPYYDLVLNGPVDQIEKLPRVLAFLSAHGIEADAKLLMQAWIVARPIKGVFFEAFWCFGGAYLIYCWYRNEWERALRIAVKAVLGSISVLFAYAIVEVAYLAGSPIAKDILSFINPYIHTIVTHHGWWPPLLWNGQVRLVFAEPSHVGNFIAFALPLLWYVYFTAEKKKACFLFMMTVGMSFLVFMTKARTAYAMLFGMLALLFCLFIFGKQYGFWKKFLGILLAVAIGFGGYLSFGTVMQMSKGNAGTTVKEMATRSVEDNLLSLASGNKRSNGARYALIMSNLRVGAQHPGLGVGRGLASAFVAENFTEEEAKNREVASWIRYQKERGPMATGYSIGGAMNEYVSRFSNSGLLGLGVFLFPFGFALLKLLGKWRRDRNAEAMFIAFALISLLVAGCNGSLNVVYAVWILLGLGYAIVFGRKNNSE